MEVIQPMDGLLHYLNFLILSLQPGGWDKIKDKHMQLTWNKIWLYFRLCQSPLEWRS